MRDSGQNPLNTVLGPITRMVALACGYVLLFLAVVLSFEIIARKLFTISIQGVDDLGGYVLAFSTSIGICYALVTRGHTRVDILLARLPVKLRAVCHVLAMTCMGALGVFAAWRCSGVLFESIEFQSVATNPLQTPLWQPQSVWMVGMVLFAAISAVYAMHALWLFFTGGKGLIAWYGLPGEREDDLKPATGNERSDEGGSHE